jgi:hypothetical protein
MRNTNAKCCWPPIIELEIIFVLHPISIDKKKQVQKWPAEKGFRVRWRCASNHQSFSESFRETKDLANAKRF